MGNAIFITIAVFCSFETAGAQALLGVKNLPQGFANGAIHPEQIPDTEAYQLVLMSLRLPATPTPAATGHQAAKLKAMGLSAGDRSILQEEVARFATSYGTWRESQTVPSRMLDSVSLRAQVANIVESTRALLRNRLSKDGLSKLDQFVQIAKSRMVVKP
jgi:hypothetical protein